MSLTDASGGWSLADDYPSSAIAFVYIMSPTWFVIAT